MNTRLLKSLPAATGLILLLTITGPLHGEGENPHLVYRQHDPAQCAVCHTETLEIKGEEPLMSKNLPVALDTFSQDGVAMCSSCHDPAQGHKVGLNIDFAVPADMPLSPDSDIICLTCHYTHGSLESDRPQASFSFMDRLMNPERLKKSFLLRRNNSDGELCLTCHNVNQGSK